MALGREEESSNLSELPTGDPLWCLAAAGKQPESVGLRVSRKFWALTLVLPREMGMQMCPVTYVLGGGTESKVSTAEAPEYLPGLIGAVHLGWLCGLQSFGSRHGKGSWLAIGPASLGTQPHLMPSAQGRLSD